MFAKTLQPGGLADGSSTSTVQVDTQKPELHIGNAAYTNDPNATLYFIAGATAVNNIPAAATHQR